MIRLAIGRSATNALRFPAHLTNLAARTAYILNSLKHPAEAETLRDIYGEAAIVISLYEPKHTRQKRLANAIAKSKMRNKHATHDQEAAKLVDKDEKEVGDDLGQSVRDVFHLADLFVSDTKNDGTNFVLSQQVNRFVQILFGAPYRTPTLDENGIFHARAAAVRSADLSRQVGAVLTTNVGQLIAAGCNEVPMAGGGHFWEGFSDDSKDYRDFQEGADQSAIMKREMVTEIVEALRTEGWLSKKLAGLSVNQVVSKALDADDAIFGEKRISDILEFGRIVHAEMAAISDAARRGLAVEGSTLYCTTFPCHMCARHIISTGIRRVVYIEPYPKSKTKDLYVRLVRVDGDDTADENAVKFEPFIGISPNRYIQLFSKSRRKDDAGFALDEGVSDNGLPIVNVDRLYTESEIGYVKSLPDI